MFRMFKRSPLTAALILSVALGATIGTLTAVVGASAVSGGDFAYRGRSDPPPPLPALGGHFVRITEEVVRSPQEGAFPGRDSWVTVTWARIDEHGVMAQFRSVTTGADGQVRQDQLYNAGSEVVNSSDWMGTGHACSESLEIGDIGSGIPTLDSGSLTGRGFELVDEVDGIETWRASGPVVSGFQSTTQEIYVRSDKGYDLGSKLSGSTPDGSSSVIYSRRVSIEESVTPPADSFTMARLGPCPGHTPTESVGREVK